MIRIEITGGKEILKNLHDVQASEARRLETGLVKAGFYLQRKSMLVVPVDTGALKNSAYTAKRFSGLRTEVYVGYTQSYAIYVHEIITNKHANGTMAKFLEYPMYWERETIRDIIQKELEGNGYSISGTLSPGSTPMMQPPVSKSKGVQGIMRALARIFGRLLR